MVIWRLFVLFGQLVTFVIRKKGNWGRGYLCQVVSLYSY